MDSTEAIMEIVFAFIGFFFYGLLIFGFIFLLYLFYKLIKVIQEGNKIRQKELEFYETKSKILENNVKVKIMEVSKNPEN